MTPSPPHRGSVSDGAADGGKPAPRDDSRQLWAAVDTGWVMVVELITATFVWGGIGWLLDRWLGTAPWLMVAGFVVGWGTGIYLVWLRSNPARPAPEARVDARPPGGGPGQSEDATAKGEVRANR
jgi:F0F1-type ATP synthase assembly protein I